MKKLLFLFLLCNFALGQNFAYSGYIYNSAGVGVANIPVKLYQRTTPTLAGFTSQNNYNGHSYYRSTGSMTWTNARTACSNMGGHLVTVTTAAENSFIYGLWPSGWIGLTDEVIEGTWKWVTGEAYSYTSWNGGEPNNSGNEDYIQFVGAGKWNDLNNNNSLPYVLEFDYILTTSPWVLYKTVYTDVNGKYTINETSNPSIEWYLQIDAVPPLSLSISDAIGSNLKAINRNFNAWDYYKYDVNGDGKITISDTYYIYSKKNGRFLSWLLSLPNSRLFTSSQYLIINPSSSNLRTTYPGVQSVTINSPVSGTTTGNYYLVNTGYSN